MRRSQLKGVLRKRLAQAGRDLFSCSWWTCPPLLTTQRFIIRRAFLGFEAAFLGCLGHN